MSISKNLCPHLPPRDANADEWHQRRALIRRELRRHKISDNLLRIAEIILDLSLGQGLNQVLVPDHDCFAELTGVKRSHVSEALQALREMRIVRQSSTNGVPTYSVREDPDPEGLSPFAWRVQPRVTLRDMERSISLIREYNSLPPLPDQAALEAISNFKVGADTQNVSPENPEKGFREESEQ